MEPQFFAGARVVPRESSALVEHGAARHKLLTESLRAGDLERGLIERGSLLRHIVWAPDSAWERWRELKAKAARFIGTTHSPALADLPLLTAAQRDGGS